METVLIVGTKKGAAILRSDDGRENWSFDGLELPGWIVTAAERDAGGRFYLGVTSDVYGPAVMVSDDLKRWRQVEHGPRYEAGKPGNAAHNRIISATDPMGQYEGVQRHLDQIWKLKVANGRVYAAVSEAGLFRSEDRGESFEPVQGFNDHPSRDTWWPGFGGLAAHAILVDGGNPERMWVGVSAAGVFRTEDGGRTWERVNEGVPDVRGYCVHSLAHDPSSPDVIYRQDHAGVFKTENGGDTWERIETGLPVSEMGDDYKCVFGFPAGMDPRTGSVYTVPLKGEGFRYPHDGALRVYRTRDGGSHWEPLSRGLPQNTYATVLRGAMALDAHDPCGVYIGTTAGSVFASADGGESWSQLPVTLPRILSVEAFTG